MKIYSKIQFLFLSLFLAAGTSCTTIKIGMGLWLRGFDGGGLIENEWQVKEILETILLTPENYTMAGYTRRAFSPEYKRTPSLYHSFYTITGSDMSFITLSFAGTKIKIQSKGVWAINTEADMESYISFKNGANEWEVQEILIDKGINTEATLKNVIDRIGTNIIYYYKDHINDRDGMENCNTALQNTLIEND